MSLNHDDEFIDDVNYGNRFPDDWYWDNAPGITFRKAKPFYPESFQAAADDYELSEDVI